MAEPTEKDMKFIEGVDLDEKNVSMEFDEVIEFELGEFVSLLYSKKAKKFMIEGIDRETDDEYIIDVEEPFKEMDIDGVHITEKDFEDFKKITMN